MSLFQKLSNETRAEIANLSSFAQREIQYLAADELAVLAIVKTNWPIFVSVFAAGVLLGIVS